MYHRIMVPLDGSAAAEGALPHLKAIAKGCGAREVVLVRVIEPVRRVEDAFYPLDEKDIELAEEKGRSLARDYLDRLASQLDLGRTKVKTEVLFGSVPKQLTEYAEKSQADLILLSTHGKSGLGHLVWGSVAYHILHASQVPVLTVRAPA
jgi:nucleotide-binding universal stress UspA family protein